MEVDLNRNLANARRCSSDEYDFSTDILFENGSCSGDKGREESIVKEEEEERNRKDGMRELIDHIHSLLLKMGEVGLKKGGRVWN